MFFWSTQAIKKKEIWKQKKVDFIYLILMLIRVKSGDDMMSN